jgi:hypothetical protein
VFVSSRVKQRVEFVKAAADASYLWLKLMLCLGVLKYTFVYVECRRNPVSIRSDLLPPVRMIVCRMMFWSTKAKVLRP